MKKLLILVLIAMLSATMAFSQDTTDLDAIINSHTNADGDINFEELMDDPQVSDDPTIILPALLEPDENGETPIDDVNFAPVLDPEGDGVDQTTLDTITQALEDEGYSAEEIETTTQIVDALAAGDTITDIKNNPDIDYDAFQDSIADAVASQIKDDLIDADTQVAIEDALNIVGLALDALNGFAQSTALTSNSSNMFGYQNYKIFTASIGLYGGFALNSPLDSLDKIMNMETGDDPIEDMKTFFKDNNIQAGITGQAFSLSAGINMNWLVEDLYLGVVAGSTDIAMNDVDGLEVLVLGIPATTIDMDTIDPDGTTFEDIPAFDMTMGSSVFGVRANYRLIDSVGIPVLFRWNGVSLGSGFIVNTMNTEATIDLSELVNLTPGMLEATYSLDSTTFTIPLEASTAVQLVSVLTVTAGAGIDIQFGESNMEMDLAMDESTIAGKIVNKTIQSILQGEKDENGNYTGLEFPVHKTNNPEIINPRINAGIGLGIGPVVFDLSGYYYFNTGFALGANFIIRI